MAPCCASIKPSWICLATLARNMWDITERKRTESRLTLQYAISKILSESHDFVKSAQSILRAVCESLDWEVGALWRVDHQTETMHCVDMYHATSLKTAEFDRLTQTIAFKKGIGLPGRIWELSRPVWLNNVLADGNFPRAGVAARDGLRGAFGFP